MFFLSPERAIGQAEVTGVDPQPNSVQVQPSDVIEIDFNRTVETSPSGVQVGVFGSRHGEYRVDLTIPSPETIRVEPECPFLPGETVTVYVFGPELSSPTTWQFTIRSNRGAGRFEPQPAISIGAPKNADTTEKSGSVVIPSVPYSGDFDQDGFGDVAVVNQERGQVVVLSRIAASSPTQTEISAPGAMTLSAGDVVGNGLPDLVAVNSFENTLTVMENQGAASFPESGHRPISTGSRPLDVAIADVNGDGLQDLAVTAFGEDQVEVYRNNGGGDFDTAPDRYPVGAAPTSIIARDIDNDEALDLVVASAGEDRIDWLQNDGSGQFSMNGSYPLDFTPAALDAADLGGQGIGWVDIVVSAQNEGRTVALYHDTDPSTFGFEQPVPLPGSSNPALGIDLADVNADSNGDLDLASVHPGANEVQIALNAGQSFQEGPTLPTDIAAASTVALDFDADSDQDIAVFDRRGTTLQLFRNTDGIESIATANPDPVNFDVCVGESSSLPVNVDIDFSDLTQNSVTVDASVSNGVFGVSPGTIAIERDDPQGALDVTFTPERDSTYEGELVLIIRRGSEESKCRRSGGRGERITVDLNGTGRATDLSASQETVDFGEVLVDQEGTETFSISNQGNISADLSVEGLEGSPFSIEAPASVGPGGSQTLTARFQPQTAGTFSREAQINASSTCGTETVTVTLTGQTGPPTPDLVADRVAVVGGTPGEVNVTESLEIACVLSNQGNEDVTQPFSVQLARDGEIIETFRPSGVDRGDSLQTSSAEVPFPEEGTASVSCTVDAGEEISERQEDNNVATREISVQVTEQLNVSPNPFTPNEDGFNDAVRFMVGEFGLDSPEIGIYSFEGREIRTISEVVGGEMRWEGEDDDGEEQEPGVYLYVVRDGGQRVTSGHVTLAR